MKLLQALLLRLPPEVAHSIAILYFRVRQWIFFKLRRKTLPMAVPSIHIDSVRGLSFPNRLGLAAGFDKNAVAFGSLLRLGFGFIEVGTVTPRPQKGNPRPRVWRPAPGVLLNHLGFNSHGVEAFRSNLLSYRSKTRGIPVLANIGKNKDTPNDRALDDYALVAGRLRDCVDGFVVNVSSPNTPELRALQSESFFEALRDRMPRELPILIKLAPDLEDSNLEALLAVVRELFSGVVLTNTSTQLAASLYPGSKGGLSGKPLFDRALQCVSIARKSLGPDKCVVGVGGISSKLHALRMREAGADLVEIYTGFIYQGPKLVTDLGSALK